MNLFSETSQFHDSQMNKDRYPVKAVLILIEGRLDDVQVKQAIAMLRQPSATQETGTLRKLDATNVSVRALDLDAIYEGAYR